MTRSIIRTISLDAETLRIANELPNFSRWIRAQLKCKHDGVDVTQEKLHRIKGFQMVHAMAEYIAGQENDYETPDDVKNDFRNFVESQLSLEDFD